MPTEREADARPTPTDLEELARELVREYRSTVRTTRPVNTRPSVPSQPTKAHLVAVLKEQGLSEVAALHRILDDADGVIAENTDALARIAQTELAAGHEAAQRAFDASEAGRRAQGKEALKQRQETAADAETADAFLRRQGSLSPSDIDKMPAEEKVALWLRGDFTPSPIEVASSAVRTRSKYSASEPAREDGNDLDVNRTAADVDQKLES